MEFLAKPVENVERKEERLINSLVQQEFGIAKSSSVICFDPVVRLAYAPRLSVPDIGLHRTSRLEMKPVL